VSSANLVQLNSLAVADRVKPSFVMLDTRAL